MKTVAIVGSHPATRENAPWDDPGVDIWVFNEACTNVRAKDDPTLWVKRCDAVFQMHIPGVYRSPVNRSAPRHWEWLQQSHDFPIYMQAIDLAVPASQAFPLAEIANELLGDLIIGQIHLRGFFTSSIAYAFALAIYQEYDHILVYGVEMSSETEYFYQRECIAFWIALALGHGIRVDLYSAKAIFERPLYGYDGTIEQDIDTYLVRANELNDELGKARSTVGHAEHALHTCYRTETFPGDAIGVLLAAQIELGTVEGQVESVDRYLSKLQTMRQTGATLYLDRNEFESAAAAVKDDIEKYGQEVHRSAGRLDYVLMAWKQLHTQTALEQVKQFAKAHLDAGYNFGKAQGIYQENRRLAEKLDESIRAAGGEKTLSVLRAGAKELT